jgi:nitrite reductase (NO-forming)
MPATLPPDLDPLSPAAEAPPPAEEADRERAWREWMMVGLGLAALVAIMAVVVAVAALASGNDRAAAPAATAEPAADAPATPAAAPTIDEAAGIEFEPFERVDPTLPEVPAGKVKKFEVDVYEHVTQVSKDLAPTEVWSYAVNGVEHRGTGVSEPLVVNEGDMVDFTLVNGSDESMNVTLPHSLDFHSAKVNPGTRYADLAPGEKMNYRFEAKHPGVFMYHCATQPVLLHTGAGMMGMMVVKPKGLAPVDHELWINQQEYYIGEPGGQADMGKLEAKNPDVIAFNGFANQYQEEPITVGKDETVRMYVLNSGPSIWSAFHVIGTVFDRTIVEGVEGSSAQTINLAPSQGGIVEFTLDEEGTYPFVTHAFGDTGKGALGVIATENPPQGAGHDHGATEAAAEGEGAAAAEGDVAVTLGDMWVEADKASFEAGEITFAVTNEGATMHGLAIVEAPAKVAGAGVDESTYLAKGGDLAAGESETLTADLAPGTYELICYVAGHYAAGQTMEFTVG